MLGEFAALDATWEREGSEKVSLFTPSGGQSVLTEVAFSGTEDECVNSYHMGGNRLALTHHSTQGKQSHLSASYPPRGIEGSAAYNFKLVRVTNLGEDQDGFLGALTVVLLDQGDLREEWTHIDRSGAAVETTTIDMQPSSKSL